MRVTPRLALLALVCVGCNAGTSRKMTPPANSPTTQVDNLVAFSRLYGYVKYFHPSDEAATLDWQRFAVYGARTVRAATNRRELLELLRKLFSPIAPTVSIELEGVAPASEPAAARTEELRVVAWQHRGDGVDRDTGLYGTSQIYKSVRTHRPRPISESQPGCVLEPVDKALVAGKRIRVTAWIRGEDEGMSSAHVTARVYVRKRFEAPSAYQSGRVPLTREWTRHAFERDVPADARSVEAGVCLYYDGEVEVDGISVAIASDNDWAKVPLSDPSFEEREQFAKVGEAGFEIAVRKTDAPDGSHAARIARATGLLPGAMFEDHAEIGERATVVLGNGLVAYVPLALWSDQDHTLPRGSPNTLEGELSATSVASANELDVRLGAVIVAWNAIEHFFPYFDVVATDWDAALREGLGRALRDGDERAFAVTLNVLMEHLDDGHADFKHDRLRTYEGVLPIALDWVEDQLLITASRDDSAPVGSRVVQIAGQPTEDWQQTQEATVSGSPQWKRRRATWRLLYGPTGTTADLVLADSDGAERPITLTRIPEKDEPHERSGAPVRSLGDGIYYVDLDRASWAEIRTRLDALADAAGVVFDLRGYPNSNHEILSHLLRTKDDHTWMFIPSLSHPWKLKAPLWQAEGWELEPKQPHIAGEVAFLTDGRAASYAESVIGLVEGYELGIIVGAPTTGVNGNVKVVNLPGEFALWWTGMRVVRHDGSRLHGIGIPPTYSARRTIAGIRAGRDEVLDTALDLLRTRIQEANVEPHQ